MLMNAERTQELKNHEKEVLDEWLRYEFCTYKLTEFTDFCIAEVSDHFGENKYTLILKNGTVYNSNFDDLGEILMNS